VRAGRRLQRSHGHGSGESPRRPPVVALAWARPARGRSEFVADLPKTLTGKIRRIELRQHELDRAAQT
jgi:acyl-CoA synthetase (AMP-forming)/AMP-acid ligase II